MTTTENPKGPNGETLCAWCGKGPVPPSRGTKPRAYCSRSCVHRASRKRRTERLIAKAYTAGKADAAAWTAKSRDVSTDQGKSRDDAGERSRDFPKQQVTPPKPAAAERQEEPPTFLLGFGFGASRTVPEASTEEQPDGEGPPSRA
jgi:hypothetical protein